MDHCTAITTLDYATLRQAVADLDTIKRADAEPGLRDDLAFALAEHNRLRLARTNGDELYAHSLALDLSQLLTLPADDLLPVAQSHLWGGTRETIIVETLARLASELRGAVSPRHEHRVDDGQHPAIARAHRQTREHGTRRGRRTA